MAREAGYFKKKFAELRKNGVAQDKVFLFCILEELEKINEKLSLIENLAKEEEKEEEKKETTTRRKTTTTKK